MSQIRTTCPYCGVGCGLLVSADGAITGDPDHPANFGRLCSKGAALGETVGLAGRLLAPRIGSREVGWDEATGLVADKFTAAIAEHGPDSVAFYVSGQMLTEDYYVANKLMKGFIGSANIDTNSRLCMASSVAGHKRAFGTDTVPGTYQDFDQADLVVLVGSNLAWCHPVLYQRLLAAKVERPALKIVVIDPRRTATCNGADMHLPIKADGDIALFNGLLAEIVRRGAVDQNYVGAHVSGFDATMETASATDTATTGLTPAERAEFYDLWIATAKVVTVYSQGVNQSVCGSDKVNSIINCHLATGRIGKPGTGPFSVTGQPNAMGGREVGGLANTLACHLDIENTEHRQTVQDHWASPNICKEQGLKAVDLFKACDSGKIKALWIISTNPAVSMPDAGSVAGAIAKVPFCVVSDVTDTDTTALADVVLPATAWGEKTGTITNSERRISLQKAFMPAPGDARPDWQIICQVASKMGWQKQFAYENPAEIFREYAALSGRAAGLGRDFDISGLASLSDEEYGDLKPVMWPAPMVNSDGRFFAAGKFYHRDGKAQMVPVSLPREIKSAPGTFHLNSGRIRDQWHTMTRSGSSPRLSQHRPEPFVEIHPDDALLLGIENESLAQVTSLQGKAVLRAQLSRNIQRGTVFVPMHWSAKNASAGKVNALVADNVDPVSGQPALKAGRVRLTAFKAQWLIFAASSAPMVPRYAYGSVAITPGGWRCDLASNTTPDNWEKEARAVLNLTDGTVSLLQDTNRGIVRVAIHDGPVLKGLFFASSGSLDVNRTHVIAQINCKQPALSALMGLPLADQPDPGSTVCACFNVGQNTIKNALASGATTLEALGKLTSAGTNCGSCKPDLQAMMDAFSMPAAAG